MTDRPIDYNAPDYKRSRTAYLLHYAFEYFASLVLTGAFLTKLLVNIGLTDAQTGIVACIATLACLFQLLSMLVVQKISNTKRFVLLVYNAGRILFVALFTVPFWPIPAAVKGTVAILCILLGYLGYYMANVMIFPWANSFVDPAHRAEFSSLRETAPLIFGMAFTLFLGYRMDAFEAQGLAENGFLFCASALLIFVVCDFICMMNIKNRIRPKTAKKSVPFRVVLQKTLGNRSFRNMVIVSTVYNVAVYISLSFLSTYQLNGHELAFSVGTVQIFSIIGSLVRVFLAKPIGRYSDRTSFARGIKLGMILSAIGFGACIFATPQTRYLAVVQIVFYAASVAGTNANFINSTYSYVESEYFVQAEAIKNSIGGTCGFLISLVSGRFLSWVQANGNVFLGIPVHGQQVQCLITTVMIVGCILFIHFVIEKQPVLKQ